VQDLSSVSKVPAPKFEWRYLTPKYWLTWLVVGFLYLLSWLPFRLQLWLGRQIGNLLHRVLKKRRKIAAQNIALCFPDKSRAEIDKLVKINFQNTGIAMFESGMAWWWPKWRLQRKIQIKGAEHIHAIQKQGKGPFVLFSHVLPLEMMGRVLNEFSPYVGFYRPHNNALLEWLQFNGRCQNQSHMIGKKDVKALLKSLSKGFISVYLPDHDYGKNRSVFVPLFAVKDAATTTGTEIFASQKNAVTVPTLLERLPGTQGYQLTFLPPLENYPSDDSEENARTINQWVERSILNNVEQYMWVHRRFKTRPENNPESLYK
jgi:KDO2-lipid IV(A) lauroyltransferase